MHGDAGIFKNARPGTLLIDSSTIDPIMSKQLIQEASARGLGMIDAPVSGGVTGAAAGTLTFMVGGEEQNIASAEVGVMFISLGYKNYIISSFDFLFVLSKYNASNSI